MGTERTGEAIHWNSQQLRVCRRVSESYYNRPAKSRKFDRRHIHKVRVYRTYGRKRAIPDTLWCVSQCDGMAGRAECAYGVS